MHLQMHWYVLYMHMSVHACFLGCLFAFRFIYSLLVVLIDV